ncbi:PepSY domain-containing protein [Alkalihalobacillus trypoxylicola]|uniref:PepSY domain-containing protein n=1 Tax=Alkalihalobacillus trypoxylicola TaxID=519424 RepID=A0A161Q712_9BACI|nr:PepSY domain-containing protein [Alkalihalobacillus trypoxylicola]KYG32218.1 hypothetical protein AZF04_05480 [Alkalihalobacillus trypoxylicola]
MKKWMYVIGTSFVLFGCNNGAPDVNESPVDEGGGASEEEQTMDAKPDLRTEEIKVDWKQAVEIFKEHFQADDITEIELDNDFSVLYYNIQGTDQVKEYELEIDANTEEILKEEQETLDQEDLNELASEILDLENILNPEELLQIVADDTDGQIEGWQLYKENNVEIFEVEVKETSGEDIDYILDATNGEMLRKED